MSIHKRNNQFRQYDKQVTNEQAASNTSIALAALAMSIAVHTSYGDC